MRTAILVVTVALVTLLTLRTQTVPPGVTGPPTPLPGTSNAFGFYVFGDQQDNVTQQSISGNKNPLFSNEIADAISRVGTYQVAFAVTTGDNTNFCTAAEFNVVYGTPNNPGYVGYWDLNQYIPLITIPGDHEYPLPEPCATNWGSFVGQYSAWTPNYMIAHYDSTYGLALYEVPIPGGRVALIVGASFDTETGWNPGFLQETQWIDSQVYAWRLAHPKMPVFAVTHKHFSEDGSCCTAGDGRITTWELTPADATKGGNNFDLFISGHWGVTTDYYNYTETTMPTGGHVLKQIQIDHQDGQGNPHRGTYVIFEIDQYGRGDGCAYKTAPSAIGDTPPPGWLTPGTFECTAFDLGLGWGPTSVISGTATLLGSAVIH